MSKRIVINITREESRVALLENDIVTELYMDRSRDRGVVGNIYKGRVIRVLPGMQAAFVDIGLAKAAFLYVADISGPTENMDDHELDSEPGGRGRRKNSSMKPIEELIHQNDEIIVQVVKEPLGTKGPRVTSYISLPGRYLVYMPTVNHLGISRRIESEEERTRLREIVEGMDKPEGGYIVRTVSQGTVEEDFAADVRYFKLLWNRIKRKLKKVSPPAILHNDLDLVTRIIRDIFTDNIDELIIDSKVEHKNILEFIESFKRDLHSRIKLYKETEPIFDAYGIEMEITKALGRKVWLKSGGYIIIDYTEALTVIDVNTGRYVGKKNLEDTIFNTNVEAAKEIACQMRLRNIGGIIIIDFIDMESEKNRTKVVTVLSDSLVGDKAKSNIFSISDLGLVEMSRERVRGDLMRVLCDPCPYCDAKGYLKSPATVSYEILRELRQGFWMMNGDSITIEAHTDVAALLYDEEQESIAELDILKDKKLTIKENQSFHVEQFEIY